MATLQTLTFGTLATSIVSGLLSCTSNDFNREVHTLKPGVGFDNIELNQLTLADVNENFGTNFKTDTFYIHPIIAPSSSDWSSSEREIFSYRLFYETSGISFFFKPDSNKITALRVEQPFKAQTEKGIILNKSTFYEIIKSYGDSPWYFVGDYILKEYDGIKFYRHFYQDIPANDSILNKYLDSTVTEISIDARNK